MEDDDLGEGWYWVKPVDSKSTNEPVPMYRVHDYWENGFGETYAGDVYVAISERLIPPEVK